MSSKRAVVVFSGGLDSTVLLHYVKSLGYKIYGVSFDYDQRHRKELEYARYWAEKLCEDWKIVNLSFMKEMFKNTVLLDDSKEMPHSHYTDESQKVTVVPNRNMIMLSIAVGLAENLGIKEVFYGPHVNDYTIYPDCRPEFIQAVSRASELGTYNNVKIIAPFKNMEKWQIVSLGYHLKVDFSKTWSCYEGKDEHCGKCASCQERKEAFMLAGVKDLTKYKEV